jgi:hypothetical protein
MKSSATHIIGPKCKETLRRPMYLHVLNVKGINPRPLNPLDLYTPCPFWMDNIIQWPSTLSDLSHYVDEGFDSIMTLTDCLGSKIQVISCTTTLTVEELAHLFFINWYCKNGLSRDLICDHDKLFIS